MENNKKSNTIRKPNRLAREKRVHPGKDDKMLAALREKFIPGKVVMLRTGEDSEIIGLSEYTRNLTSIEGRATAYVCWNYSCNLPVTDTEKMLELLKADLM